MWLQYYQPLISDLVQKALVKLCQDNVPHSGKLEIDGILCISCGTVEKQIVVKVHDVIGSNCNETQSKARILQVPGYKRKLSCDGDSDVLCKSAKKDHVLNLSSPQAHKNACVEAFDTKQSSDCLETGQLSAESVCSNKPEDKKFESTLGKNKPKSPTKAGVSLLKLLSDTAEFNTKTGIFEKPDQEACVAKNDKEIQCRVCGKVFKTVALLQTHTSSVHKRHLCKHCFNTFSLRCNLNRHERLHTGVKPYPCSKCSRSFARNADLRLHMQKHESDRESSPASCHLCQKEFPQRQDLLFHLFKIHKVQDGMHACTICEQVFEDEDKYNVHWESHAVSLQQHGKIEVSPRLPANPNPPTLIPVDKSVSRNHINRTPPVLCREKPYKSLLPPKIKPLVKPEADRDGQETLEVNKPNDPPSSFLTLSTDSMETKVTSAVDLDAIKKEFGPLFHYNDDSSSGCGDPASSMESPILFTALSQRDGGKSKLEDKIVEPVSKNKRKSRPQRVLLDSDDDHDSMLDLKAKPVPLPLLNKPVSLLPGRWFSDKKDKSSSNNKAHTPKKEKKQSIAASDDSFDESAVELRTKETETEGQMSPSPDVLADDDALYECRYGGCGQHLNSFRAYEEHFYSAHGRYPCKMCEQSFTCKNNRTRHIRNHLGLNKKHSCDICSKVFSRPDTLQEHKFIHTKSYLQDLCNSCGATFDRKAVLLSHIKKCLKSKSNMLEEDLKGALTLENGDSKSAKSKIS